MKWLLDTNVVSEGMRVRPNARVRAWIAQRPPEQCAISIVTLAELHEGANLVPTSEQQIIYRRWISDDIVPLFSGRTFPVSIEILTDWLSLARRLRAKGRSKSGPDLLIAATARVHDLIVVSRNTRDFAGAGVTVLDPWTGTSHEMEQP